MSDHAVPILLNHDHGKPIGVFEAGIVTFLPDHRPTKEEFASIFGNVGYTLTESIIDTHDVVRIGTAKIHEFSISPAPLAFIPDWGKAERIDHVLEFTQALAKDPRGAAFIGQQVAEILATGKSVYVKVVIPTNQEGA